MSIITKEQLDKLELEMNREILSNVVFGTRYRKAGNAWVKAAEQYDRQDNEM